MNKNDSNNLIYTSEKENIIRQRWLGSIYLYAFWAFFYYGFSVLLAFYQDSINNTMQKNKIYAGLLFALILITGVLFVHYYFGYKRKGACLLVWTTILGGLIFITTIPALVSEIKSLFIDFGLSNSTINCYYILGIGGICVWAYYLINTWKLYLLNFSIKYGSKKNEKIVNLMDMPLYPETPSQDIQEAYKLLRFAFRLQCSFKENLIDKICFTKSFEIDTGTGTRLKERNFEQREVNILFHNLVLSTLSTLVIAVDKALDKTFGAKDSSSKNNINSLRSLFYMLRCAFAHDAIHPKWHVKEGKYQGVYMITVPKEIIQKETQKNDAEQEEYPFNFEELNNKTVTLQPFRGIDGILFLSIFAAELTANSSLQK